MCPGMEQAQDNPRVPLEAWNDPAPIPESPHRLQGELGALGMVLEPQRERKSFYQIQWFLLRDQRDGQRTCGSGQRHSQPGNGIHRWKCGSLFTAVLSRMQKKHLPFVVPSQNVLTQGRVFVQPSFPLNVF